MPIYAYRYDACGRAKDVLQEMSDAPLTGYPACSAPAFKKQLTAAGSQLRGSGWYVADFHGGSDSVLTAAPATGSVAKTKPAVPVAAAVSSDSASSGADTPAASGDCGTSCACH